MPGAHFHETNKQVSEPQPDKRDLARDYTETLQRPSFLKLTSCPSRFRLPALHSPPVDLLRRAVACDESVCSGRHLFALLLHELCLGGKRAVAVRRCHQALGPGEAGTGLVWAWESSTGTKAQGMFRLSGSRSGYARTLQ